MGIKRTAPDTDSYADADDDAATTTPVYEPEDADEVPANPGIIQSGWGEAAKRISQTSTITADFKPTEENQLIAFKVSKPFIFMQHWLDARQGKKSFICLGKGGCPLCDTLGDTPSLKTAFQVVNLSSEDDNIVVQWWVAGTRVFKQLEKFNDDPKVGPLDKGYFSVSKTGKGSDTVHTIVPVKERDLEDDWDLDTAAVKALLAGLDALDEVTLRKPTLQELKAVAAEMS